MACAAERGQRGLGLTHFRSHDELAMVENARNSLLHAPPKPPALGGNVNERERRGVEACVSIHRHKGCLAGSGQAVTRRAAARSGVALDTGRPSRQRMAISRLATPSSPVTAGCSPERIALTKACSSARNGSA